MAELLNKYTKAFDISKDGGKLIHCLWPGLCSPVAAGLRCMGCAHRGKRSPLANRGNRPRPWRGRHKNGKKSEGHHADDTPPVDLDIDFRIGQHAHICHRNPKPTRI